MFRIFTAAAMLTLTLALPLAAAQADPVGNVYFGDLDLSRPADAQSLNNRIEKAAETACISLRGMRPWTFYNSWYAHCVSDAAARTSARIAALTSGKYRTVASK
jgi:UrcA family protein